MLQLHNNVRFYTVKTLGYPQKPNISCMSQIPFLLKLHGGCSNDVLMGSSTMQDNHPDDRNNYKTSKRLCRKWRKKPEDPISITRPGTIRCWLSATRLTFSRKCAISHHSLRSRKKLVMHFLKHSLTTATYFTTHNHRSNSLNSKRLWISRRSVK
jgi:hypothetical protein